MQRLCSSFRVVWETATVGFSWIGGGCTFASRIGTAMAGVWGGKRSRVKTAMSMGCQWNASGMPVGCQWDANGMPMGCQWEGFWFKCKVFFAEICVRSHLAIPAVFFKYPLFFYYSFSFYFFFTFPPSLLRNLHRHQPSYCYISTFVVKSIRLRTSRRSSSRRSLSVFPSQNRPCDHWL